MPNENSETEDFYSCLCLLFYMSKTLFEREFTTHSIRRSAAQWAASKEQADGIQNGVFQSDMFYFGLHFAGFDKKLTPGPC